MSELTTLLELKATPAAVQFDFEGAKAWLTKELEKYENIVVTVDSVADDKKLAQEVKAKSRDINRLRIDTKKALLEPITEFEEQTKELSGMCDTLSLQIETQVKKFEQIRLDNLTQQLMTLRDKLRAELNIEEVHFSAEFDDLIKLGSLTKTDNLTKSAREEMEQRVNKELQAQQRTEMRLLQLENECLKSGMDAPLTRENVEAFLYQDDASYQARLSGLIQNELERQVRAREAHERRIKEEQERLAIQQAQREQERLATEHPEPEPAPEPSLEAYGEPHCIEPEPHNQETYQAPHSQHYQPSNERHSDNMNSSQITKTVAAYFTVTVPSHVPNHAIENKLKRMLSDAGITSLTNIEVMQ